MARIKFSKIFLILFLGLGLFCLESLIKYYFLNKIPKQGFYLFGKFLQIIYTPNYQLAFSIPFPRILIIIMIFGILIILGYFWWLNLIKNRLLKFFAITIIIFGALSNLLDRLFFSYVIDYLNLKFWPVFNLADCLIVGGIIIFLFSEFKLKSK